MNFYKLMFIVQKLIIILVISDVTNTDATMLREFYSSDTLQDGVHETSLYMRGIWAKEFVAGPMSGSQRGIVVREMSNGKQLLVVIYNGIPFYLRPEEGAPDEEGAPPPLMIPDAEGLLMRDCKVTKDPHEVEEFVKSFHEESGKKSQSSLTENMTYVKRSRSGDLLLPEHYRHLTEFRDLKHKCFRLHQKIRRLTRNQKKETASHFNRTSLRRSRRGVTNLLSIPNTKWCGKGYSASSFGDLGGLYGADSCCRQHDLHCPFYIRAFERKYGYFHFGLGTISHCSCDRRFKTCLKQTDTGASNVVGKVFFSIIKSNCFDFKLKKVCRKKGFWFCKKWGYEKQAVIRDPIQWSYT